MKTSVIWKEGMQFNAVAGSHQVLTDAKTPLGKDAGPTPKELVALGLAGCTAMDVIALLKKHKQGTEHFSVETDIQPSTGSHPMVFEKAVLTYKAEGKIDEQIFLDAVKLSQTKYCGVSAMLSKAFPIEYAVVLNGRQIGVGTAHFEAVNEPQVVS